MISVTPGEREDYNGFLRVAVTGGGDGGGTVATVEIVASENTGKYMIDDEEVDTRQLHAGDGAKTHLQFVPIHRLRPL